MRKMIFITGSSSGIGFEIGLRLLSKGNFVIFSGRSRKKFEDEMLKRNSSKEYAFLEYDFLQTDAMEYVDRFFTDNNYVPDIVIHALGGKIINDKHPINQSILSESLRLNCGFAIELDAKVIPIMQKKGEGYIVHMGSLAGINANAAPCYSIAKAALHAYVKNAARFYASSGIIIFGIVPGIMDHDGSEWANKKILESEKYNRKKEQTILKKFAKPSDIACYVDALLDVANPFIAGSLIEFSNE